MADPSYQIVHSALQGMIAGPNRLQDAFDFYAKQVAPSIKYTSEDLIQRLSSGDPNDPVRRAFAEALARWDFAEADGWTANTAKNTHERRVLVYSLLDVDQKFRELTDQVVPVYIAGDPEILLSEKHEPWYYPADPKQRHFYWDAYKKYLAQVRRWPPESIELLGEATTAVVERLSNPSQPALYQARGLVVGHVQSGKTANFTGVVAKAADAGYRLIIILAGTMNILRRQTQRRIDKELIGVEQLGDEYIDDDEWSLFLSHGSLPSLLNAFDWQRLTGRTEDYKRLQYLIGALDFERADHSKYFYDPFNLSRAKARIMVIKKNVTVLKRVAGDLSHIKARLQEIPALVIDDESDQASLNTRAPTAAETKARTATNEAITKLLAQLPRSQYVGYTATPYANVFVDPDDAADLFPKDFLYGLKRPPGYMGADAFHDLDGKVAGYKSNEKAYVRSVYSEDEAPENLPKAIDSYILSGAIKLFRKTNDQPFKHHTMLVHVSERVRQQAEIAQSIEVLLDEAGYNAGSGIERLRLLWENDYKPVSAARGQGEPPPAAFDQLREHIGECLRRLEDGPKRVLIVNGEHDEDSPDFDRTSVWKIVVGGAKLSRGYTIEGLTVSYYRRKAAAADTLMQMGRWFGFRHGYQDLIRLFIGRDEPLDKKGNRIDLYAAFEAVCRDEIRFREQLGRYTELGGVTPKQVPPLVQSSSALLPTSKNKMFNAVITSQNFGRDWKESTMAPVETADILANQTSLLEMIKTGSLEKSELGVDRAKFGAWVSILGRESAKNFLKKYVWLGGGTPDMRRVTEFVEGKFGDPAIDDWLFLAPLLVSSKRRWHQFDVIHRSRVQTGGRYGVYSDPHHVKAAEYVSLGLHENTVNDPLRKLKGSRRAVFVFYAIQDTDKERDISIGFGLQFPDNRIPRAITFSVRDPKQPEAVVVDAPPGA